MDNIEEEEHTQEHPDNVSGDQQGPHGPDTL